MCPVSRKLPVFVFVRAVGSCNYTAVSLAIYLLAHNFLSKDCPPQREDFTGIVTPPLFNLNLHIILSVVIIVSV